MLEKEALTEVVKQVINEYDKQYKEKSKRKRDRRLRNTDLLLRNYDNLLKHIEHAIEDERKLEQEDPEEVFEYLECIDDRNGDYEGVYIDAIKRTKTRTKIIVKHIEIALDFYKYKSEISNSLNDKRKYEVIYKYYFENKKIPEIADEIKCSEKTVGRDKKKAVEELSVLFFGIDGIKFLV